jgi:hypothetical protein
MATALEMLKSGIDDAFETGAHVESFLTELRRAHVKTHDFARAVSCLPNPGGAFNGRGPVLTAYSHLYSGLSNAEQQEATDHYKKQVDAVAQRFPNLKKNFEKEFSD